jgi:outer membrane protein OmpA-like peptidoglycan-associated protein/cytochrome c-type biogenesis protein CcmH/NrfG
MRTGLLLSLFLLTGYVSLAQVKEEDKALSWRAKLDKADQLMENGSYYNAIDYYEAVLEDKPDAGDVMMKLANTAYAGRNYDKALEYYQKAFELDRDKYRLAQYYYALMLKMNSQYKDAIENFEDFRRNNRASNDHERELERLTRTDVDGCEMAMEMEQAGQQGRERTEITRMGNEINGKYSEYSPIFLGQDSALMFGTIRVDSVPVIDDPKKDTIPKGKFYTTIWSGSNWTTPRRLGQPFNDPEMHTGNGSFGPGGNKFYFTKCEEEQGALVKCDIYVTEKDGEDEWSKPKKMKINDKDASSKHPIIVPYRGDQVMLIFSTNREDGTSGYDLWYAVENRNGEIDNPRRLYGRINSYKDEITPWYDPQEDALYFASNGLDNIGGFDIYKAERRGSRSWKTPVNVGMPINSSYDEFYYQHQPGGKKGVFVSNRSGALSPKWPHCCDDIWMFEKIKNPIFTIMGKVYVKGDTTHTPVADANVELFFADNDQKADTAVSDTAKGFEFFRGTEYKNYRLEARKEGYTYGVNTTSTVGLEEDDTVYANLYLTPIEEIGTVVLKNVYFDLDKAFIREDAKPSLDTVYRLLKENPNIKIELSSHTDSRAPDDYNMDLSQRRADSSKAYLVNKGIDPERIVAKGYGETKLLNDCDDGVPCSDIEHQVNRRTEFKVIGEVEGGIVTYGQGEIEDVQGKKRKGELEGDEQI